MFQCDPTNDQESDMAKFLALYMGNGQPPVQPSPDDIQRGMAAWTKWMADHASIVTDTGGPLGKTKKASKAGISDGSNHVAGYVVVEAASHEAAAKLFENHPHFAIFPGDSVEIMPVMPIPGS
jgi:hypothetical protein